LFPKSLISIILILVFNTALSDWIGQNWSWIKLILIVPAAIFEKFQSGLFNDQDVSEDIWISLAGWYYERFEHVTIPRVNIPWFVMHRRIIQKEKISRAFCE